MRRFATVWVPPCLVLAGLVALWEAWVRVRDIPRYVLPAPSRVAAAFWEMKGTLGPHVATTLVETVLGVLAGAAVGLSVAIAIAAWPLLRRMLEPLLVASQTIPLIVLAPLLVLWFGFGMAPKVVVVVLIVFFPVTIATTAGLLAADRDQIDLVRSLGGSRSQLFRLVLFPAALPSFFAGLRIAGAYAVAGAVYGEFVGGERGLGLVILRANNSAKVDRVLVAVAIITVLSAGLFALVHLVSRLATPWLYLSHERTPRP